MNRNTHETAGAIAGALAYLARMKNINQKPNLWDGVAAAISGALGGILPDQLEPATNPFHRGPHHSILRGIGLVQQIKMVLESPYVPETRKQQLLTLYSGYLSHLILDSTTPAGLPIL